MSDEMDITVDKASKDSSRHRRPKRLKHNAQSGQRGNSEMHTENS